MRMRLAVATVLFFALSACGGGSESDNMKNCSAIWAEGKSMPETYDGCETDDTIEAAVTYECIEGPGLVPFKEEFYAYLGGMIEPYNEDAFAEELQKCTDEGTETDTESDTAATASCLDIWIVGETLSDDYTGCVPEDGQTDFGVAACDSGIGDWAGIENEDGSEIYAMLGGEILAGEGAAYDKFYADCFTDN